ncbi:MAG: hypothetical protein GTO40_18035 [Deltaproteobacteria bacterium]|nr:hypothetical protein [Deltaproteobacteria bacterium]
MGVPEFRQTAAVWAKGALQHDYGVDLTTIRWVEGGINEARPPDELDLKPEGSFSLEFAPRGKSLDDMLDTGELDALLGARRPTSFGSNPNVQRLFPNFREVEKDYYRRTGIFPIMHTMVIKESLYREHPWVAESIYKAMVDSKKWVLERIREGGTLRFMLPWLWDDLEQLDQFFAGDGWPYGLESNRNTLDTLMEHLVEQGLMDHKVPVDELFLPL